MTLNRARTPVRYTAHDWNVIDEILEEAEARLWQHTSRPNAPTLQSADVMLIIISSYEDVLRRRGMQPTLETRVYRFLIGLELQKAAWWRPINPEAAVSSFLPG